MLICYFLLIAQFYNIRYKKQQQKASEMHEILSKTAKFCDFVKEDELFIK